MPSEPSTMNPYGMSDDTVIEFQRMQQNDNFIQKILRKERLPRSFIFLGSILFHRKSGNESIVIPTLCLQALIDSMHRSITGTHFSVTKIEKCIRKFFFVDIRILRKLLKSTRRCCNECQKPPTKDLTYPKLIGSETKTLVVHQLSNNDLIVTFILDPQTRMIWSSVDRSITPFSDIWPKQIDLPFKINNVIFLNYQPDRKTTNFLENFGIKIMEFNEYPSSLLDLFIFFERLINRYKNVQIDHLVSDLTKANNDLFLPFCPSQVKYSGENFLTLVCKNVLSDPGYPITKWHVNTPLQFTYEFGFCKLFPPKKEM